MSLRTPPTHHSGQLFPLDRQRLVNRRADSPSYRCGDLSINQAANVRESAQPDQKHWATAQPCLRSEAETEATHLRLPRTRTARNPERIGNLLLRNRLRCFRIIKKKEVRVVESAKRLNGSVAARDHSIRTHPKVLRTDRQQSLNIYCRGRLTVHVIFLQLSFYDLFLLFYSVF